MVLIQYMATSFISNFMHHVRIDSAEGQHVPQGRLFAGSIVPMAQHDHLAVVTRQQWECIHIIILNHNVFSAEPDVPEGSPDAEKPFHGANVWPDPSLLPAFRPAAEAYLGHLKQLSTRHVPWSIDTRKHM